MANSTCGMCGQRATRHDRIDYQVTLTPEKAEKHGARRLRLALEFCDGCGPKVWKHLKRMFPLTHFEGAH